MVKNLGAALAVGILVVACGNSGQTAKTVKIAKVETVKNSSAAPSTLPTSADRFGTSHASDMGMGMPSAPGMTSGGGLSLAWTRPEGWKDAPPKPMRQANFTISDSPGAECYMTILGGNGGGVEPNVNRWRKQMSQPAYSSDEFAHLQRRNVLGQQAVIVDTGGTFTGMSDNVKKEGYKLLGAIFDYQGSAVFVKMTGPAAVVDKEKNHFYAFLDSLHPASGGAGTMAESSSMPAGHPDMGMGGKAPLTWTAPAGWKKGPKKPMRSVTYLAGKAECAVIVLPGTAGGVPANINRWRGQMGQGALNADQLAKLPKVKVLGQDAPMLEATGAYTGMEGGTHAGYMLLGVIGDVPGGKVFIKMTGPEADVKAEKEHFIAFCQSLK